MYNNLCNCSLDSSPLWLSDVDESEEMMGAGAGLNEMEYLAYFEPDDEVFDEVSEAEFELTEEELAVMK